MTLTDILRIHAGKKYNKQNLPTLPNFFSSVTINTELIIIGPIRYRLHLKKEAFNLFCSNEFNQENITK